MQPQHGYQRQYPPTQPNSDRNDEPRDDAADSGYAMDCPECGERLEDMHHREKHAIAHYGEDLIPRYHNHNLAAERKGLLLGVDPERLRR